MGYRVTLDKVDKELGYMYMMWITTKGNIHSATRRKKLKTYNKLTGSECLEWEPLHGISGFGEAIKCHLWCSVRGEGQVYVRSAE